MGPPRFELRSYRPHRQRIPLPYGPASESRAFRQLSASFQTHRAAACTHSVCVSPPLLARAVVNQFLCSGGGFRSLSTHLGWRSTRSGSAASTSRWRICSDGGCSNPAWTGFSGTAKLSSNARFGSWSPNSPTSGAPQCAAGSVATSPAPHAYRPQRSQRSSARATKTKTKTSDGAYASGSRGASSSPSSRAAIRSTASPSYTANPSVRPMM